MRQERPLSPKDPLGNFEPPWATKLLIFLIIVLAVVALLHQLRRDFLSFMGGLRFIGLWLLVFYAGGITAVVVAFVRCRRLQTQIENRRCQRCGYDLRGSPERCPECGTIPQQPVKIKPSSSDH